MRDIYIRSFGRLLTSLSIPGKFAVERYPALKYIPTFLAPWKAEVLKQRQMDIELYMQLLNDIRDKTARGVCPPCFARHGLEEQVNLGMTDLELAYAMSTPFGAGIETVSHLNSFRCRGTFQYQALTVYHALVRRLPC